MKYPPSEHLRDVIGPDGERYHLEFYGENEGAAVVTGPAPRPNQVRMQLVPEVHREPATDVGDARTKLAAWLRAAGWSS